MAEDWVIEPLVKLNPAIQERPERAQEGADPSKSGDPLCPQ